LIQIYTNTNYCLVAFCIWILDPNHKVAVDEFAADLDEDNVSLTFADLAGLNIFVVLVSLHSLLLAPPQHLRAGGSLWLTVSIYAFVYSTVIHASWRTAGHGAATHFEGERIWLSQAWLSHA
jgi:hypothetical protein